MRAVVHCFTERAPDAVIHFQLIDLGQQLYIWVGVGGAKLQNMYLAIQSKQVCRCVCCSGGVCAQAPSSATRTSHIVAVIAGWSACCCHSVA